MKRQYIIDGDAFFSLEEFAHHFSSTVLEGYEWRGHLDAFNDILRGGFGTPAGGFSLVWRNHRVSVERLGHPETVRRLERLLTTCDPSNIPRLEAALVAARQGLGPTLFDELVEIIRLHGPGGREEEDGVDLVLE